MNKEANATYKMAGLEYTIVPSFDFYINDRFRNNPGSNYMRFSFSQKLETLKNAIGRIEKRLI
jgi:hypothetical protein